MNHPLDNPVWSALSGRQNHFNRGDERVKYFPADVAPFVGLKNWDEEDLELLAERLPPGRTYSVPLIKEFILPAVFEKVLSLPLYQMHCPVLQPVSNPAIITRELSDTDIPMMLELTALTKPGPFFGRTIDFGNYRGIFENDRLVAMAGDRMKTAGYTEVSAICTHPDHTGKKYASYLTTQAASRIIDAGDIPFLHVRTDNLGAISVYKKIGFEIRTGINYTIFRRR